ncbi:MAG TPA: CBS domain-containing protein [Balneolaceae bacterium]|nr:CBS domain-containing protein [Balneolaceae bacterium]
MLVSEATDTKAAILSKNQRVGQALEQMDVLDVNALPVVDEQTGKLVGQITRNQLTDAADPFKIIGELTMQEPIKIFKSQHLFNAIQLMLKYEMSLLPVVDSNWIYEGMIHKKEVLESLTGMLNITEYGSVITIELSPNDFSLSEIVQLIETEGGKILGITVEAPDAEIGNYEISIKLNVKDVSRIASALRRYDYTILTELESDYVHTDLETRADELIKYLEV